MPTTREKQTTEAATPELGDPEFGTFAGEFRPLAKQQRFKRRKDTSDEPVAAADPAPAPPTDVPAPEPRARRANLRTVEPETPTSSFARVQPKSVVAAAPAPAAPALPDETYTMLVELSRMADRVIDSREQLVAERARAERAGRDVRKMNERIMAARALVHEAQRTARIAADRCHYLEGRCESLQDALDLAVNASLMQRWKWRRAVARSRRDDQQ